MTHPSEVNFRALFRYDQALGVLIRISTGKPTYVMWKRKKNGRTERPYGFVVAYGRRYAVHRAVWAVVHGEWPAGDLDHIDRDTRNNQIENLRLALPVTNSRNKTRAKNNTSGHNGIDWSQGGWRVRVGTVFGGRYNNLELAIKVRDLLYKELGYTENYGCD
jgi:hypothetical protein